MKKNRRIIMLLAMLILLSGGYVYSKQKIQPEKALAESETVKPELIMAVEMNLIEKIELRSVERTVVLEKKSGQWLFPSLEHVLDQSRAYGLAEVFAGLYADKVIEEKAEDLEKYGLKSPAVTATVTLSSGEEKVLYLGDRTPLGDTFYVMAKDTPRVYTIWMNYGFSLLQRAEDFRDRSLPELNPKELKYIRIAQKDRPVLELEYNENQSANDRAFGVNTWRMIKPYSYPVYVDLGRLENMYMALAQLQIDEFVEDNPSDLSVYGLDRPEAEVFLKDEKNILHILIGKEKDDKRTYFKLAEGEAVYAMDRSFAQAFKIAPFSIAQKFTYLMDIYNVNKVIVEANGKRSELAFTRIIEKATKAGEQDETIITYEFNGKPVSQDSSKRFYESLVSLMVDAEYTEKVQEKPEVKTTFILEKGEQKEVQVNYVPYNTEFYAVFRDGKSHFLVSRNQIRNMLRELENIK
jgi:hypothetical protein